MNNNVWNSRRGIKWCRGREARVRGRSGGQRRRRGEYILVCSQGKAKEDARKGVRKEGRRGGRLLLGFSFNKTEYLIRNKCSRGKNGEIERRDLDSSFGEEKEREEGEEQQRLWDFYSFPFPSWIYRVIEEEWRMISARMRRCADIYMIVPCMKGKASESMRNRKKANREKVFLSWNIDSIDFSLLSLSRSIVIFFSFFFCARTFVPSFNVPFECVFLPSEVIWFRFTYVRTIILSCFCIVLRF